MAITLEQIKELRNRTGVGIHQVKEALVESDGDVEKAILYLRKKGIAKAAKRSGNSAENGYVAHYIHGDGHIGVLVELNSETDFASRNEKFRELARDIAVHVAASSPEYVTVEEIPQEVLDREKEVYMKDLDGKPAEVQEKIVAGKMEKYYEEVVLMKQKFVKDENKTVEDLLNDAVSAIGEKIEVGRFARFQIGGSANVGGVK